MVIYISDVLWLDEDIQEAEVILTDTFFALKCFSHPFYGSVGEPYNKKIHCYDIFEPKISCEKKYKVVKDNENQWGYFLTGCLVDKDSKIVKVGEFEFNLSEHNLPSDFCEGDFIQFYVDRLDLY